MKAVILPAGEVAYALRKRLGPLRAWPDFLTDCIRHATSFHGLVLCPIGYVRKGGKRPVYLLKDVEEFIRRAEEVAEPVATTKGWLVDIVELDPADRRHWKVRLLTPVGP